MYLHSSTVITSYGHHKGPHTKTYKLRQIHDVSIDSETNFVNAVQKVL